MEEMNDEGGTKPSCSSRSFKPHSAPLVEPSSANIYRNQNREKALDRNGMVVIQSVRNQESRYVGFLQGGVTHLYKEGSKGVGIT